MKNSQHSILIFVISLFGFTVTSRPEFFYLTTIFMVKSVIDFLREYNDLRKNTNRL